MASQRHDQDYTVWVPVLLLGLIIFTILLLWYAFGEDILWGLHYVRIAELEAYGFISDNPNIKAVLEGGPYVFANGAKIDIYQYNAGYSQLALYSWQTKAGLTWSDFTYINATAAHFYKWPAAALMFVMAAIVIVKSPAGRFKSVFDLQGLINTQAKTWPVIKPIVNYHPEDGSNRRPGDLVPDILPTFAEALSPEEWLAHNRVAIENGMPDRDAVRRSYIHQLGGHWRGAKALPPHRRALFAVFALKGARKREEGDELLGKIAACWSEEHGFKINRELLTEVNSICKDPKVGGIAEKKAAKYAFVSTAMAGVLAWCRTEGGVLAPASFLWLRAVDRKLWYPLNNVGRRSFHSEAAGIMAHFIAEKKAERALLIPRVETAIDSICEYVVTMKPEIPPAGKAA